jgi:hypothetical protein
MHLFEIHLRKFKIFFIRALAGETCDCSHESAGLIKDRKFLG